MNMILKSDTEYSDNIDQSQRDQELQFEKDENEFIDILKEYMKYQQNLHQQFEESEHRDEESERIKKILQDNSCSEVQLVYVVKKAVNNEKCIYFFRLVYEGKMYIIKIFLFGIVNEEELKGVKVPPQIVSQLKIIRDYSKHILLTSLNNYFRFVEYMYSLHETLADNWKSAEKQQLIKNTLIEKGCELVQPMELSNFNTDSGETSYLYKIKYNEEYCVLKAIQRTYMQFDDSQNRQSNLFMKQFTLEANLKKYILDVIENHPLHSELNSSLPNYIFVFYEYYICSLADIFSYMNQNCEILNRLPYLIMERIVIEVSKFLNLVKSRDLKIPQFYLHNIYITYHSVKLSQQYIIQIKFGNLSSYNTSAESDDLRKQMRFIIKQLIYFTKSSNKNKEVKELFFKQLVEKKINDDEKLDDYLNLFIKSSYQCYSKKLRQVTVGNFQSITHQVQGQQLYDDILMSNSTIYSEEDDGDDYYDDEEKSKSSMVSSNYYSRIEEEKNKIDDKEERQLKKEDSRDSQQFQQSEENVTDGGENFLHQSYDLVTEQADDDLSMKTVDSLRYKIRNSTNFNYFKILKQIYEHNKAQITNNNINVSMQKVYYQSFEFKKIESILTEKGYKNIQFVKLGQNSRHFVCSNSNSSLSQYYLKVYNKKKQHKHTKEFLENQHNAKKTIKWIPEDEEDLLENGRKTQSETIFSSFGDYSNNILLNNLDEINDKDFRIFVYKKCLCNLRDLLPYLQDTFIKFEESNGIAFQVQNLYQEIALQIVYILQCIHKAQLVHMDLDLTKFLIDTNGTIRMSNFQFCTEPNKVNIEVAKCFNKVYQKQLSNIYGVEESHIDTRIKSGIFNQKFIKADYFMLGFSLTELFFCLDSKRLLQRLLDYNSNYISSTLLKDQSEVLKLKQMLPHKSIQFDNQLNITSSQINYEQSFFQDKTSELSQKLGNVAKELININTVNISSAKDYLSTLIQTLENIN